MGISISDNYEDVQPLFSVGVWKVSSAIHKQSKEPVSLWQIDYPFMKIHEKGTAAIFNALR